MDKNEKIILEVQKYEFLYNQQLPEFRNVAYKDTFWKKIGNELQIPWGEVKKKFRNMRDAYKKSKKIFKTGNNDFRKPYKYTEQLRFLDSFPTTEISNRHISDSSLDITTDTYSDTEYSFTNKKPKLENKNEDEDPFLHTGIDLSNENDSETSALTQRVEMPKTLATEDLLQKQLKDSFDIPTSSVANKTVRSRRKPRRKVNCTMQLFECLAKKVIETRLTKQQINEIEISVCNLVYTKIDEYGLDLESSF